MQQPLCKKLEGFLHNLCSITAHQGLAESRPEALEADLGSGAVQAGPGALEGEGWQVDLMQPGSCLLGGAVTQQDLAS